MPGYDIIGELAAGEISSRRFGIDVPGVWEIELQGADAPLFDMVVM